MILHLYAQMIIANDYGLSYLFRVELKIVIGPGKIGF